jgi:hypothetical protein
LEAGAAAWAEATVQGSCIECSPSARNSFRVRSNRLISTAWSFLSARLDRPELFGFAAGERPLFCAKQMFQPVQGMSGDALADIAGGAEIKNFAPKTSH